MGLTTLLVIKKIHAIVFTSARVADDERVVLVSVGTDSCHSNCNGTVCGSGLQEEIGACFLLFYILWWRAEGKQLW